MIIKVLFSTNIQRNRAILIQLSSDLLDISHLFFCPHTLIVDITQLPTALTAARNDPIWRPSAYLEERTHTYEILYFSYHVPEMYMKELVIVEGI